MMDQAEVREMEPGGEAMQMGGVGGGVGGGGGGAEAGGGGGTHEERNTRASRWSMNETLVLIAAKRKEMEEDREARARGKITHDSNKWSLVAQYCNEQMVYRDASQCKKRWHSLYTEYKKIKDYERENGDGVLLYWHMSADKRRECTLASMFEREVFDQMDAFLSRSPKLLPEATFESGALDANIAVADLEGQEPNSQGSSMEIGGVRNEAAGTEKNHRASRWTVLKTLILIMAKKADASDEHDGPKKGRAI